jgi:hypothetical protein
MKMKSQEFSFEFKGKEGLFAGSRKCVDREVYCGLRGAGGSAPAKNDLMCRQKYQSIYIRATIQLPAISIASISLCSLIKLGAGCSFGVLAAAEFTLVSSHLFDMMLQQPAVPNINARRLGICGDDFLQDRRQRAVSNEQSASLLEIRWKSRAELPALLDKLDVLRRDSVGDIRRDVTEQRDHLYQRRHPGCATTDIDPDIVSTARRAIEKEIPSVP